MRSLKGSRPTWVWGPRGRPEEGSSNFQVSSHFTREYGTLKDPPGVTLRRTRDLNYAKFE